jgi:hypothetical protein
VKWAIEVADGSNYSVNIRHKITKRRTDRRKKVEHHAEEMSLCDPRKASKLTRAQRLVRKHVKQGTSLVDELLAERREATRNE